MRPISERLAPWLVACVAVLAYANSLGNDFAYDDVPVIVEGSRLQQTSSWREIWTTDYWYDLRKQSPYRDLLYRPFTLTTIRVVRTLFGHDAFPQRIVNLSLHAAVSVLVLGMARTLMARRFAATLGALLFALLPIHAEAVNAITGRADLLVAVCLLASLYLHSRISGSQTWGAVAGWTLSAGVTAFAAMASKETGLAVVPLLILADAFIQRSVPQTDKKTWFSAATAGRLAYLIVPISLYLALRYHALGGYFSQPVVPTKAMNALVDSTSLERALGPIQLWGMYWAKTIWPATLNIKYTIRDTTVASTPFNSHVFVGLAVLAVMCMKSRTHWLRNNRAPALVLAALLICYFPVSNTLVIVQEFFAERFWYVPSLFAMVFVTLILPELSPSHRFKWPAALVISVVCVTLAVRCWIRNADWRSNGTLYAAAYRDAPNSVGSLIIYGDWLTRNSRAGEGIGLLQRALSIDPSNVDAHRSLAHAYTNQGNAVAAEVHFKAVATFNPQATPYNNLGVSLARQGRYAEAEQMFQRALADPDAAAFARYNLGLICQRTERTAEAITHWEEAFRLDPKSQPSADGLIALYISLERVPNALRIYESATQSMPEHPRYWLGAARILATSKSNQLRDGRRALEMAQKAKVLAGGDDATVLSVIAAAYAELGDFGEAMRIALDAEKLAAASDPAFKSALAQQIQLYRSGQPYRDPRF